MQNKGEIIMNVLFVVTHDYEFLNRACNCYVRIDKINCSKK